MKSFRVSLFLLAAFIICGATLAAAEVEKTPDPTNEKEAMAIPEATAAEGDALIKAVNNHPIVRWVDACSASPEAQVKVWQQRAGTKVQFEVHQAPLLCLLLGIWPNNGLNNGLNNYGLVDSQGKPLLIAYLHTDQNISYPIPDPKQIIAVVAGNGTAARRLSPAQLKPLTRPVVEYVVIKRGLNRVLDDYQADNLPLNEVITSLSEEAGADLILPQCPERISLHCRGQSIAEIMTNLSESSNKWQISLPNSYEPSVSITNFFLNKVTTEIESLGFSQLLSRSAPAVSQEGLTALGSMVLSQVNDGFRHSVIVGYKTPSEASKKE